jgi:hypothetical protein
VVEVNDMTRLVVHVDPVEGVEADELEALTHQVRREVLELDVERADLVASGAPPSGAKSGNAASVASIAVTMFAAGVPPLVSTLHTWFTSRRPRCTLRIEGPDGRTLEIPNLSLERANDLMAGWAAPRKPS